MPGANVHGCVYVLHFSSALYFFFGVTIYHLRFAVGLARLSNVPKGVQRGCIALASVHRLGSRTLPRLTHPTRNCQAPTTLPRQQRQQQQQQQQQVLHPITLRLQIAIVHSHNHRRILHPWLSGTEAARRTRRRWGVPAGQSCTRWRRTIRYETLPHRHFVHSTGSCAGDPDEGLALMGLDGVAAAFSL